MVRLRLSLKEILTQNRALSEPNSPGLRARAWIKLAADEKDLPASQSPTQTNPRLHGPDGNPRRAQGAEAPTRKRAQTPEHLDPAQTAGVTPQRSPQSFTTADRLHRSAEFLHLQRKGVRVQSKHFVLYAGRLGYGAERRLGITVSRRIGSAIVRNLLKRRIREFFRLSLRDNIPQGVSITVIALSGAGLLEMAAIAQELAAATLNVIERLQARG
jgi:ribonuclease P protein component